MLLSCLGDVSNSGRFLQEHEHGGAAGRIFTDFPWFLNSDIGSSGGVPPSCQRMVMVNIHNSQQFLVQVNQMVYSPSGDSLWVATGGNPGEKWSSRTEIGGRLMSSGLKQDCWSHSVHSSVFILLAMFPSLCQAIGGKLHIFPSDSLQKPERSAPQLMVDGSWRGWRSTSLPNDCDLLIYVSSYPIGKYNIIS